MARKSPSSTLPPTTATWTTIDFDYDGAATSTGKYGVQAGRRPASLTCLHSSATTFKTKLPLDLKRTTDDLGGQHPARLYLPFPFDRARPHHRHRQPPWGMRTRPSSHLRAHVTHHSYGGLDGVWADCEGLCRAPLAPVIAPSNEAPRVDFVSSSSPDYDSDYDMEDCERGPHPALPGLSIWDLGSVPPAPAIAPNAMLLSLFAHLSDYDTDLDMGTGTGFDCDQEYERRPHFRMPSTGTHHSYGGLDGTGRDGWDVGSGAFCAVPSSSRGGWRSLRIFSAAATARRYLD
ncbi:hypothetical protein FB107DRAFT_273405 [Schizophyllum commune]